VSLFFTPMLCVMVDITALYLKMLNNWKSLKESQHWLLSVGPHILCKTGYWWFEKFKATVKEVTNLNWKYYKKILVCWKREATNGENTHSKCCSSSPGTPASGALCSSTQNPVINSTNSDFPNLVGKTAKTSLLRTQLAIASLCSAL